MAIAAISAARRTAGLSEPVVVDVHPDRPDQRGIMRPDGQLVLLPEEPGIEQLSDAGGRPELQSEAHLLGGGFFLGSGAIDRLTAYELGLDDHHSIRDGKVTPDPLIMDERFVAAEVKGRGVTVLSACSHAGIVNACTGARSHFPDVPVDVVLGGYHLAGASMEGRIAQTVDDLDALISPRIVSPGHCTGWRAKAALAQRFAPGRYAPSAVGTRFFLSSPG